MKLLTRILSLITIICLSIFFVNCGGGGGGGTSKEKTQLKKLSKTWSIATTNGADLDGVDRTADFTDFKLKIEGTYNSDSPEGPYQYSVTGSRPDPSPWPASGTWEFANISSGNEGNLVREDDVTMHYKINSNGQLVLNVQCMTCDYEGARTSAVNGPWTFTFNP
jgi:hypothetical protein